MVLCDYGASFDSCLIISPWKCISEPATGSADSAADLPAGDPVVAAADQPAPSAAVSISNAQKAAALLNPSQRKADLSLQELDELYLNLDSFLDALRECRGSKVQ